MNLLTLYKILIFATLDMSKRKKTAPVIDSDSDESDSGSNLDEVCMRFT